jgi:hypothetical protein
MFQTPAGPEGSSPLPASAPHQAPVPQQSGPGEFTRYFQAPPVTAPGQPVHPAIQNPFGNQPSAQPPPAKPAGEYTQMFGVPAIPPSPVSGGPAGYPPQQYPPPAQQQGQQQAQQPGEFTRMFQAPSFQAQAPSQAAAATPASQSGQMRAAQRPSRKKKPSYIPLLIILGFVFLMALILVLFFALRK